MTWTRLRRGHLKRETESLLIAVENNSIRIMSKQDSTFRERIASLIYVAKEM